MKRILFVCLGNICRSPTAHGVMLKKIEELGLNWIHVDSAGTAAYHIGKAPDPRTLAEASKAGYDLSRLTARQVEESDFYEYDYIFAMDSENFRNLKAMRPSGSTAALHLALEFTDVDDTDVPDPYYGGASGFRDVLNLCEMLCDDILKMISEGNTCA